MGSGEKGGNPNLLDPCLILLSCRQNSFAIVNSILRGRELQTWGARQVTICPLLTGERRRQATAGRTNPVRPKIK
jgi:hypothetical protein